MTLPDFVKLVVDSKCEKVTARFSAESNSKQTREARDGVVIDYKYSVEFRAEIASPDKPRPTKLIYNHLLGTRFESQFGFDSQQARMQTYQQCLQNVNEAVSQVEDLLEQEKEAREREAQDKGRPEQWPDVTIVLEEVRQL